MGVATLSAQAVVHPTMIKFTMAMQETMQEAKRHLEAARQRQKRFADLKRSGIQFQPGDLVLLRTKYLHLKHPGSRKLLPVKVGPFPVTQVINPAANKLDLPVSFHRLHPIFHVSLLESFH